MLSRRPRRIKPARRWPSGRWAIGPAPAPADHGPDDESRWGLGPRPTANHGHEPDAWGRAFYAGFSIALDGEDPAIPAALPPYEQRAFEAGAVAGARAYDRRIDERFADHGPRETDGYAPGYYS
jgi:hypothetical protein